MHVVTSHAIAQISRRVVAHVKIQYQKGYVNYREFARVAMAPKAANSEPKKDKHCGVGTCVAPVLDPLWGEARQLWRFFSELGGTILGKMTPMHGTLFPHEMVLLHFPTSIAPFHICGHYLIYFDTVLFVFFNVFLIPGTRCDARRAGGQVSNHECWWVEAEKLDRMDLR